MKNMGDIFPALTFPFFFTIVSDLFKTSNLITFIAPGCPRLSLFVFKLWDATRGASFDLDDLGID